MSVTVHLVGGLGNQLFQYSAGLSLATRLNKRLYIDCSAFRQYKLHSFALDSMDLQLNIESYRRMLFRKVRSSKHLRSLSTTARERASIEIIRDGYRKEAIKPGSQQGFFLEGYFQSSRYFSDISGILRKSIRPGCLSRTSSQYQKLIESCNSVSVHIRRGDYVTDANANLTHGVAALSYYRKALELIQSKVSCPVFYFFSDDLDWVRKNFSSLDLNAVYCDFNGPEDGFQDMYLMSRCKHNILANSSFSWWGAWLNEHEDAVKICPKRWYVDPQKESPAERDWVTL